MNQATRTYEEQNFAEEVGLFIERLGWPRMAGRILGRLLISVPPHQSTTHLADFLLASKGSISTMTRLLVQSGIVERVSLPGERRDYFRIRPNAWLQIAMQDNLRLMTLRDLTVRGLALLEEQPPELRDRLDELRGVCEFYERELPDLLKRWEQQRNERRQWTQEARIWGRP